MERVKLSRFWKKRLVKTLLSLFVLLTVPVGIIPQEGQSKVSAAATQKQTTDQQEPGAASVAEEPLKAINEEKELLRGSRMQRLQGKSRSWYGSTAALLKRAGRLNTTQKEPWYETNNS